ncbi:MAG TPA: hypothetical protein VMB51_16190 [Solirubrobacteraceae bacterium]|nr:hypothetical protein [Solirubrobacteraceae bacterium]
MANDVKNNAKLPPDQAVMRAVEERPGATAESVAQHAGVARSTASKVLARLADASEVNRYVGGRGGGKRLPDRFTLTDVELPAAYAAQVAGGAARTDAAAKPAKGKGAKTPSAPKRGKGTASQPPPASGKPERLKAGELEPLVLGFLKRNKADAPHGPSQVANALGRSSGAVSNCLVRLTKAKKTKEITKKPRRYDLTP